MGRSSPEMTPSHSDIEKGDVKHGVCSSQEEMTPENSDNPPSQEEESTIIFKVPHRLREVNENAYEPNVISIGPYHYRKPHLARMEDFKKWWFKKFVEKPHLGLHQFREAIRPLEGKIRNCYERPLHPDLDKDEKIDKEKFVDMMVYDGCFVVQLILEDHQYDWKLGQYISAEIFQDLLLLENQLPFFVLLELHLLDLVHSTFQPTEIQAKVEKTEPCCVPKNTRIHLLSVPPKPEMQIQEQLKECMFGITFDEGTKELKIPTLQVDDFTERLFRNYMAYEQFLPSGQPIYFVDYVVFIDDLINTSKDVERLRKSGIIDNLLGNDEAVTQMFNKLLNDHCEKDWNIWKAKLKKDYFHTPWSPISFLAALVLLLLTILQTIFSILSYNQQRQLDY
ncbi:hypothetical protein V6Z11_D13G189000 [Gossypium hirsutum]